MVRAGSRRAALLMVAGAVTAAVSGCGAAAVQPAASTQPPASSASPTTSPGVLAKTGLAALQPCGLLSPAERSAAGLTSAGTEKTIGPARACDWTEPGVFGLTITFDESSGLSDLTVEKGTGKKITVGRHKAITVSDKGAADGTCAVLLAAGDSASVQVDVSNSSFSDTTLACQRADTVAKLIEPKLPG